GGLLRLPGLVDPPPRAFCDPSRAHPPPRLRVIPARRFRALLIRAAAKVASSLSRRIIFMRQHLRHSVLAALLLIATTPACALDLPARKAGLWEVKMTFDGRNLPPQVMQQCIDASTD